MSFSNKQLRVLFVIGIVLGMVIAPAIASHLDNSTETDDVPLHAPDGPAAIFTEAGDANLTNPFPDKNTVRFWSSNGNITLTSNGRTNATVTQINGTWTNTTNIDASTTELTLDPGDKPALSVSGDVTAVNYRGDISLSDDKTALEYSASASGTITVNGLPGDTDFTAATPNGNLIESGTTTGGGQAEFGVSSATSQDVILFTNSAPQFDDDSADAGNGRTRTLSVNVTDKDFTTSQGDEVTVDFYLSEPENDTYTYVGNDTLTSNGTASTTVSSDLGGTYTWYGNATDSYGKSTKSSTYSFDSPSYLYVRNETAANNLVNNTTVTIRWYGDNQVYENTTTSGKIDLTGLPIQEFTVDIDSDGYHSRTVYIKDLYTQQNVFLLDENESSVETRYRLNDPTGLFPSQSVLYISKPIEVNGTVKYRTVYADEFGTEGVTATLMQGERYRLRIESPSGTTQDLGPYRADVSETVEIRPSAAAVNIDNLEDGWGTNAGLDNRTLTVEYSDPDELTDSLTVTIYERNNESNQLRSSETYTDLGNLSSTYTLTENESKKTWVVEYEIDRDGKTFTVTEIVENNPTLVHSGLDDVWKTIFGVGALMVFAGIFSVLNVGVGAIMLALMGGVLWWTGWLAAATSGAAVVIYLFTAVLYNIYRSGGP